MRITTRFLSPVGHQLHLAGRVLKRGFVSMIQIDLSPTTPTPWID